MNTEAENLENQRRVQFERREDQVGITILDGLDEPIATAVLSLSLFMQAVSEMMQVQAPEPPKPRGGRMHAVGKLIKAGETPPRRRSDGDG